MSLIFAKSWPSVPYLLSLTEHNECSGANGAIALETLLSTFSKPRELGALFSFNAPALYLASLG